MAKMIEKIRLIKWCVAALLMVSGFTQSAWADPRPGGKLVITYGMGAPRHFNPAVQSGTRIAMVGAQLFASPLRYDENWNPQPYLAKSWKVSEDGRTVTLNLVHGAVFHDGRPITSEDVAFSILSVKKHHPFKSMFAPVTAVETPDPHTLVIRLAHPQPAILLAMSPALLPVLPKHVYGDGRDLTTHPANLAPVGSGPFKLATYTPGKSIVLKRNDAYFIPRRPYLEEIVIRLEGDPAAQMVDMERREAHLMPLFNDLSGLDRLSESGHLVISNRGYEGVGPIVLLSFNLLSKPLSNKRVRQAIACALDPDFIIQYLHKGRSRRAPGPISPDSPFFAPDLKTWPEDLEKARRLLDEAGYPEGPDGKRFSLILDSLPVVRSQWKAVPLYLKEQLAKVGIAVRLRKSKDFKEYARRIANWDFDMTLDCIYNWGDPAIGVHRTYLSDNIRKGVLYANTQNYRNPRVDEILKQAAMETDPEKRKALYREFQKIVTEELPLIWINLAPHHTVYHKGLGNPPLTIWGVHSPLDDLYWETPPAARFIPPPPLSDQSPFLQRIGVRAIRLLREKGLYGSLETLKDSSQGFLDLQDSGLHVIGLTKTGMVFLNTSGQMKPGMDMSGILDLSGKPVFVQFLDAAKAPGGGTIRSAGAWPHPGTHQTGTLSAWCGRLTADDTVCAVRWEDQEGESK